MQNLITALYLNVIYLAASIILFYYSFSQAKKGTLINIGEWNKAIFKKYYLSLDSDEKV